VVGNSAIVTASSCASRIVLVGYTRVVKAGFRPGDNAAMAVIEFVDRDVEAKGKDSDANAQASDDPLGATPLRSP
jgi:hypothetical protein